MRHTYGLIAGASALALATVISVQTGLVPGLGSGAEREAPDRTAAAPDTADGPATVPAPAADPGIDPAEAATVLEAQIGEVETALADREAALAELGETLAARDATIAEMTTALAERDAELEDLRGQLAELRIELAELRDRFAFDIQLASMKAGEPVAAEVAALDDPLPPAGSGAAAARAPEQPLTTIHFDTGSARLSPGGQVHAAAAAVMLADMKLGTVRLVGFTDRTGSAARNAALANERARAVAAFLVAQGVPEQLIETAGVTEGALPVPTEAGVPEPLNRSVSIVAVPLPTT